MTVAPPLSDSATLRVFRVTQRAISQNSEEVPLILGFFLRNSLYKYQDCEIDPCHGLGSIV